MKRLLFAILLLAAGPAIAADVDYKAPIRAIDGTPIPADPNKVGSDPLMLGRVLADALIAQIPGDQPTPTEKNQRFWIAMKVHEGKQLNVDEVAIAKKVVGLAYGPLVVGRVNELLDPASVPK